MSEFRTVDCRLQDVGLELGLWLWDLGFMFAVPSRVLGIKIYGLGFWDSGQGADVGFGNMGAWGSGLRV